MKVRVRTRKGTFNAGQGWTGFLQEYDDLLRTFFNQNRLDEMAEIIRKGVVRDLDNEQQPDGGGLRPLKLATLSQKRTSKKLNETGTLRREIGFQRRGDKRIISVFGSRGEVAGYLQFGTNKMEAFNWFGVSEQTQAELMAYTQRELDKELKKVA